MNLLYPKGKEYTKALSANAYQNLAIEELIEMIAVTSEEQNLIREVLTLIPTDSETTLYRQEILEDFIKDEDFCTELEEIIKSLDLLNEFRQHSHFTLKKRASLWDLIDYMEEMEIYISLVEDITAFFGKHEVSSKGLGEISALLNDVIAIDRIDELKKIVESLRTEISTLKSVTVGINLTPELRPEEVIVLNYNTVPHLSRFTKTAWGLSIISQRRIRYREPSQFMKYICDDMEKELSKTVQKNKRELKQFINFKGYFLLDICNDLRYYLLMAKFARKLREKGCDLSMPKIDDTSACLSMKGIYNLRLSAKEDVEIVKNDFIFDEKEKLFILTGPNRGGKTMLTQAIGINALFAAQGLFIAGDSYEGYLFENILTHFPADENETIDLGRLGEEAVRVQTLVKEANEKTLVLLNETYSSTSAFDGYYLAMDLVHILKHKNVPMVFNTHIHDLACNTVEMNSWEGQSNVVSLTMEIIHNQNTFRVLRKEPDRNSYAKNIATKYGVTYEQMLEN